jgi:pimeloyl-ACP methyl ester carboxylesterase
VTKSIDIGSGEPALGPARFDTSFAHGMIDVTGSAIHYVIGGDGPPLLVLHGFAQTWWAWRKVMPALARDFTVIAMDLPGLGDSYPSTIGYDFATTASQLRAAARGLGYRRVQILAHDIGCSVAYRYARDFPQDVRRLAVTETLLPGFGAEDDFMKNWHYLFMAAQEPFPELMVNDDTYRIFYNYFYLGAALYPDTLGLTEYHSRYSDPAQRHATFQYYRALAKDSADNRRDAHAHRLTLPVLAMGSERTFGPLVANVYRRVADDVRESVAPDCGRWIPEENPEFLIDTARDFFEVTPDDIMA